ncbi:MAG: PAS-domain containing protein, partial [Rhodospirillales bacterium]|nr:PAS-domain containing protein [Rhodospirillales bacterium]
MTRAARKMEKRREQFLFLRFFATAMAVISLVGGAIGFAYTQGEHDAIIAREDAALALAGKTVSRSIITAVSDVRTVAGSLSVRRMVEQSDSWALLDLKEALLAFASSNPTYDQVRFLDATGREIVRVQASPGGPKLVDDDLLQDKSGRPYVKNTMKLVGGEIYVSPLDLNVERGKIETPIKPTIRFATPLADKFGRKKGLIVLNFNAGPMLREVREELLQARGETMILNGHGFWLLAPDQQDEWGFMLDEKRSFARRHPKIWETIQAELRGANELDGRTYIHRTLFPIEIANMSTLGEAHVHADDDGGNPDHFAIRWHFISITDISLLGSLSPAAKSAAAAAALAIILLIAAISFSAARSGTIRHRAEAELRESQSELEAQSTLLQTTLESIDQGFAVWDREQKLVAWNARCLEFWRHTDIVRKGMVMDDLIRALAEEGVFGPGNTVAITAREINRITRAGPSSHEEIRMPGGKIVSLHRYPMPSGGHASVYTDVTEARNAQQALQKSEELLAMAIENISDGFVVVDGEGRFALFNSRFQGLYPNSRDTIIRGGTYAEFVSKGAERGEYPDAEGHVNDWVAARLNQEEGAANFVQPLIGDRWVRISTRPLPDGGRVEGHVDITELKQAQETADSANKAKSEFLSSMSHELRTPLNAILGFAQLMAYNTNEPLTDSQSQAVDHILKGGKHLLELINEVLDLAKIEAGRMDLSIENVSPETVTEECISMINTAAERRGIAIEVTDHTHGVAILSADYTRLKQVMLNLMSNAVKYNVEDGRIMLGWTRPNEGFLRFTV